MASTSQDPEPRAVQAPSPSSSSNQKHRAETSSFEKKNPKGGTWDQDLSIGQSKQERVREMLYKKKRCEKEALEIVLKLIETNVDKDYVLDKASKITPQHWEDIVEERKLIGICGWVFCDKKLGNLPKQKYVIRKNRLLDITERINFCSPRCFGSSVHFKAQLLTSPLWLRDEDEEDIPIFTLLPENAPTELHGLVVFKPTSFESKDNKAEDAEEVVAEEETHEINPEDEIEEVDSDEEMDPEEEFEEV